MGEEKSGENTNRLGSFLDDPGPTTTTKALLVTVIAPCKFSTKAKKIPEEEIEEADGQHSSGLLNEIASDVRKDETGTDTRSDKKHSGKIDDDSIDDASGAGDDAVPVREEELPQDDSEEEITPDEAAAVTVGREPDEQEVNVEALLRICFQTLLEGYHLLNVPAFSTVEDKELLSRAEGEKNPNDIKGELTPWIRVEVMARPISLGVILDRLERIGVGTNVGSLSVFKAELCRTASPYLNLPGKEGEGQDESAPQKNDDATRGLDASSTNTKESTSSNEDLAKLKEERMLEEAKKEWKNAATRLRLEQVREQIAEAAAMSFDYVSLLCIASILAGVGLITDNTVIIVASMLVSPIMGPVLGLTFGSRTMDLPLVTTSFLNETLSLFVCIIIGMLVGLCAGFTNLAEETWPVNEMESRGETLGLITGIAIAVPSGMGVCLSILGGNTSSLVGVAISASLLPPAVNAGVCFMHAILIASGAVSCDSGKDQNDFAIIGAISFALTVINIACIWIAGIVMFEIKEVAPIASKGAFWERDIKTARQMNKKSKRGEKLPPVDVGALRDGFKTALAKSQRFSEKQIDSVTVKRPHQARPRYDQASLNSAFYAKTPKGKSTYLNHRLVGNGLDRVDQPDQEDTKTVGLDDMATLFGFDAEDKAALMDAFSYQ